LFQRTELADNFAVELRVCADAHRRKLTLQWRCVGGQELRVINFVAVRKALLKDAALRSNVVFGDIESGRVKIKRGLKLP
jgi:hypothetical protein